MKKALSRVLTALAAMSLTACFLVPVSASAAAAADTRLVLGSTLSYVDMSSGGYGASGEVTSSLSGGFSFWRQKDVTYKGDGSQFVRFDMPTFDAANEYFIFEMAADSPYTFRFAFECGNGAGTIWAGDPVAYEKGVHVINMKELLGEKFQSCENFHFYFWSGDSQNQLGKKAEISGMYLSRDNKLDKPDATLMNPGSKLTLNAETVIPLNEQTVAAFGSQGEMTVRPADAVKTTADASIVILPMENVDLAKTPYMYIDLKTVPLALDKGGASVTNFYFQCFKGDENLGDVNAYTPARVSPYGDVIRLDLSGVKAKMDANPGATFKLIAQFNNESKLGEAFTVNGIYLGDAVYVEKEPGKTEPSTDPSGADPSKPSPGTGDSGTVAAGGAALLLIALSAAALVRAGRKSA